MKLSFTNLYVSDIQRSVDFYKNAFGLTCRFIHESGLYAEMATGDTILAFCQHELAESLHTTGYAESNAATIPFGIQIAFEPEDVNEAYTRAVEAGAIPHSKPKVMPWGWECAFVRDPDGFLVELSKDIK